MHQLFVLGTGFLAWDDPTRGLPALHPVPAFLIRAASGKNVLVDTGNPRRLIGKERGTPWFDTPITVAPEHDLTRQLGQLGLEPRDVDLLISTHFDFDHCGNHDLFDGTGVMSLVQADHLEVAIATASFDANLWRRPGIHYETISGDIAVETGLVLLETPGHASGHQSVCVETAWGSVILAIDAIVDAASLGSGPLPDFYIQDESAWLDSRSKLLRLRDETDAFLVFGHDPDQWDLLPLAPHPFRPPSGSNLNQSSPPPRRSDA